MIPFSKTAMLGAIVLSLCAATACVQEAEPDTASLEASSQQLRARTIQCAEIAQATVDRCLLTRTAPERCAALGRTAYENCEDQVDPDPPSNCEARCESAARHTYRACIGRGTRPSVCARAARNQLRQCLTSCQPPQLTCDNILCIEGYHCEEDRRGPSCVEDPTCADRCVEAGGSRARIQACIDANCGNNACDDRCNALGRDTLGSCLRRGGDRNICLRLAHQAIDTCQRQNCPGR